MVKRPRTPKQDAWLRSPEFHAARIEALRLFNRKRLAGTRCGAKTKSTSDGRPCQQPAMANGRCRFHGGKTPSGDGWHRAQFDRKDRPDVMDWVHAKQRNHKKAERKRQRRLASMTEEERAAHERWQRSHRAGSAAERARKRDDRKTAGEIQALMARPASPPSAKAREIARLLAKLRAEETE